MLRSPPRVQSGERFVFTALFEKNDKRAGCFFAAQACGETEGNKGCLLRRGFSEKEYRRALKSGQKRERFFAKTDKKAQKAL